MERNRGAERSRERGRMEEWRGAERSPREEREKRLEGLHKVERQGREEKEERVRREESPLSVWGHRIQVLRTAVRVARVIFDTYYLYSSSGLLFVCAGQGNPPVLKPRGIMEHVVLRHWTCIFSALKFPESPPDTLRGSVRKNWSSSDTDRMLSRADTPQHVTVYRARLGCSNLIGQAATITLFCMSLIGMAALHHHQGMAVSCRAFTYTLLSFVLFKKNQARV